jgi:hypothetical protein
MKDLRTLLEASILDIEDTLSKKLDFIELTTAKTVDEYNALAKTFKNIIDGSSNRAYSSGGLKKGKPYIFFWENEFDDDHIEIAFVDKWPIIDKKKDYVDDTYYVIYWDVKTDKVEVKYDNTGNEFSSLIDTDVLNNPCGAYEVPKEFLSDLKNLTKIATKF